MDKQPAIEQPKRFVSIQVKLLVGFTLVFSIVFAGAYYWFYSFATDKALQRIEEDMVDTLVAAAEGIDGDQLEALYNDQSVIINDNGYPDDPRYWEQVNWLATVHKIEPRASLFTYVRGEEQNELIFITSHGAVQDPPFGAQFREHYIAGNPGPNYRGLTQTTRETKPYTDEFGSWISGYTPVRNSNGDVVAGLGIDFKADYVAQVQQAIIDNIVVAFAITYALLFALVFIVSKLFTTPIITLTTAARRFGEGDYEQDLPDVSIGPFSDEINTLTHVFEIMADKVRQREEKLKKQVAELKIEIDEVKRKKQVSEIVDSDFFQDLTEKARKIRSKNRKRRASSNDDAPVEKETAEKDEISE